MPALLGGLFIGVLSALPIISCCCCLWIVGGGVLASYLQSQNQPAAMSVSDGAKVGLFAGLIGSGVWLVITAALTPLQRRFLEIARSAADMPPEVQDFLQSVEGGSMAGNLFGFLIFLVVASVLATLGGMVGASYFRKDVPPALGGPINPPPLP